MTGIELLLISQLRITAQNIKTITIIVGYCNKNTKLTCNFIIDFTEELIGLHFSIYRQICQNLLTPQAQAQAQAQVQTQAPRLPHLPEEHFVSEVRKYNRTNAPDHGNSTARRNLQHIT